MAAKKSTPKKGAKKARTRRSSASGGAPSLDKRYQAESDARVLMDAEAIRNDRNRLGRATRELKRQRNALDDALGKQ